MVECPICSKPVIQSAINAHIDSGCEEHIESALPVDAPTPLPPAIENRTPNNSKLAAFFQLGQPQSSKPGNGMKENGDTRAGIAERQYAATQVTPSRPPSEKPAVTVSATQGDPPVRDHRKREREHEDESNDNVNSAGPSDSSTAPAAAPAPVPPPSKRHKPESLASAAPLADRMRPLTLDDVHGQEIVAPNGLLRALIESNRVPSLILWGGPGTGKTTIARLIASSSAARFVEINSTSTGVGECKRLFSEAKNELALTGRKTIVFCDEIHRFSKSQQDVFLAPVEQGIITLVGATTENPGFKVIGALMSRCRVFVLEPLGEEDVLRILKRALHSVASATEPPTPTPRLIDDALLSYLATASAGDARTALNLLSLALSLTTTQSTLTLPALKKALTTTLLHDRTGDSHYNHISALHKSIRGSAPSAALYYLARMLTAGEDAVYIARRLVVIASEDIGLADSSMLSLATATHAAVEKVGMPEARINLAHCVSALALAPKSVRAYRGYAAAERVVKDTGAGAIQVPIHLRQAPTKLLRELGIGRGYKYNPQYKGGRVKQDYLPEELAGRVFLGDEDLGDEDDPDLEDSPENLDVDDDQATEIAPKLVSDVDGDREPSDTTAGAVPRTDVAGAANDQSSVWEPGGDIEIDEWEA